MLALYPKVLKTERPKAMKIDVFNYHHAVAFPSPENLSEYRHKPFIAINYRVAGWVYLHSRFRGGLRKRTYFETDCVMAVQSHPRSLISVPIESAYSTFYS